MLGRDRTPAARARSVVETSTTAPSSTTEPQVRAPYDRPKTLNSTSPAPESGGPNSPSTSPGAQVKDRSSTTIRSGSAGWLAVQCSTARPAAVTGAAVDEAPSDVDDPPATGRNTSTPPTPAANAATTSRSPSTADSRIGGDGSPPTAITVAADATLASPVTAPVASRTPGAGSAVRGARATSTIACCQRSTSSARSAGPLSSITMSDASAATALASSTSRRSTTDRTPAESVGDRSSPTTPRARWIRSASLCLKDVGRRAALGGAARPPPAVPPHARPRAGRSRRWSATS